MSQAKIDPHLTSQLDSTAAASEIEAVVSLHSEDASKPAPSPERTEELARHLIDRVTLSAGMAPKKVNVFKYLGSFAVAAHPTFISHLLEQPEVKSAMANRSAKVAVA